MASSSTSQFILKIFQSGFNIACVCLIALAISHINVRTNAMEFYYLISVAFLILTALDLVSSCISKQTAQYSHEVLVNFVACALYLSAGIAVLADRCLLGWCTDHEYSPKGEKLLIAAGSLAIPNSLLYFASAATARRENAR